MSKKCSILEANRSTELSAPLPVGFVEDLLHGADIEVLGRGEAHCVDRLDRGVQDGVWIWQGVCLYTELCLEILNKLAKRATL